MIQPSLVSVFEDPLLFGSLIKDQASFSNWKVFIKAVYALPMTDDELAAYKIFTGRAKPPTKPFQEVYCIAGRRGGKSRMASFFACYLALFGNLKEHLSRGERATIACVAVDRVQARTTFNYIREILSLKIFKDIKVKELTEELELSNGVTIQVRTCDFRSLRGPSYAAIVLDEAAYFRVDGANPSEEILRSVTPGMATIPGALLLVLSSPYAKSGIVWDAFRSSWGNDNSDTLVFRAPTLALNPTIRKSIIDKALKDDYAAAKADWLGEFREDLESFLTTEVIEAAIVPGRRELPPISGQQYVGFVDPSGGRADSFTMAIAHQDRETKRIVLDRVEERKPPLAPQSVCQEYAAIFKEYGVRRIEGDRYAGSFPEIAFKDAGITLGASKLDKSGIYLEAEPLFAQGRAEILDDKTLFAQLRGLERTTRSSGRDRVDHYQGGKDDVCNSACGALVMASKPQLERHIYVIDLNPHPPTTLREFLERD